MPNLRASMLQRLEMHHFHFITQNMHEMSVTIYDN